MTQKVYKTILIALATLIGLALLPTINQGWRLPQQNKLIQISQAAELASPLNQTTSTVVVPSASFIQAADLDGATNDANNWFFNFNDGSLTSTSAIDEICLVAPVNLAVGSTIENFTVYMEDSFGGDNITAYLDRTSFLGTWNELARVNSSGIVGLTGVQDSTILTTNQAHIVSSDHNYHVSFCLPANSGGQIKVYGVTLDVTISPNFSDLYLPLILSPVEIIVVPTSLLITNNTGADLIYTVFDTPEGNITCIVLNGAADFQCGNTFTPGTYNFRAVAICGEKTGIRTYRTGNDALTPFRCL